MIRGIHVLGLVAIALSAVSVRATEFYATRYQSLPVLDWLESRPPLAAEVVDLNARAETIARQGAADRSDWLTRQLSA